MLFLLRDNPAKHNGGHKVITQIAAASTAFGYVRLAVVLLQVLHPAAAVVHHHLPALALAAQRVI